MKPFKQELAEKLKGELNEGIVKLLPSGFQTIGFVAVLNLKPELMEFKEKIAECVLEILPNIKTVCIKFDAIKGSNRTPSVEKVAGNGTETVHSENGCLYKLDVTKVMFSKGNTKERGRLPHLVNKSETIVDMFAGIGYFSIPIAKKNPPAKIFAIDTNPISVQYLKENIKLNKIKNIEPIECDNRKAPENLKGIADRVLMGYLPGTDRFLDAAFWFLKPEGGVIHFHDIYKDSELWKKPTSILKKSGEKHGMDLKISDKHVVKQYSPKTQHIVIDAEFRKN